MQQWEDCQVVRLAGIGVDNAGTSRSILTPFEPVEPLDPPARARVVRLRHWRRACRAALASHGPAGTLRTIGSARIDLLPHQLEPTLAVVRGLGSRVLLADEVGLGKTIQAGLLISELRYLGAAERVIVLTPAGLREQWAQELAGRFGLDSTIVDMREARRRSELLPVGMNPWSTLSVAIASIDYIKRPEVLPGVLGSRWDLVVVDEVHGVTPGSDRQNAVSALCRLASYAALLTATPHNGDQRAFLSLCNLGATGSEPILVFRRSRQEVPLGADRRVHRLMVTPSAEEQRMHHLLATFTRAVHVDRGRGDRDARLALTIFHKRAFSSAYSLEQSVARRIFLLTKTPSEVHQLLLPLDDAAGELNPADEAPLIHTPLLSDVAHERQQLEVLAKAARAAMTRETKLARLARLLNRFNRMREPVIVFTEYRDTLLHVEQVLATSCVVLHGGLTRAERKTALDAFATGRETLLLATDAAGEGLNLQTSCRLIINLELPWNPMRLEQRIGRVDRIGQRRTVHAVHLVASGTGETRILQRLRARVAQVDRDIGACDSLGPMMGSAESEEDATSRLVVNNDASEATGSTVSTSLTADLKVRTTFDTGADAALTFLRLTREAEAEHTRLTCQRALAQALDGAPAFRRAHNADIIGESIAAKGVVLTFTRRRNLREVIGNHALVLVQTVCEDSCGRRVAAHLTAFTMTLLTAPAAARSYERFVNAMPLEAMDPSLREWEEHTFRAHRDFWTRRLMRDCAIARRIMSGTAGPFQSGLFDRRAEREHEAGVDNRKDFDEDLRASIRLAEAAVNVTVRRAQVVLVLVPGGRS